MKRIAILGCLLSLLIGCDAGLTDKDIQQDARSATALLEFHIPIMKVSFTDTPGPEKPIHEIIDEKIKEAIEAERKLLEEKEKAEKADRYETMLTTAAVHGHQSEYRTQIVLGQLEGVPEWAKWPERVIVVHKVEEAEIDPNEDEYEGDVETISETANVSLTQAKIILNNIKGKGYRITKDEVAEEESVELLWFDDGWDDTYPVTLSWEVTVEGERDNIITGYDPRGILLVKPIPEVGSGYTKETALVSVKFGYLDLKNEFKPHALEIAELEKKLRDANQKIDDMEKEDLEPVERDIRNATLFDVWNGSVKLETFWAMSSGTGVYLGDIAWEPEDKNGYHWRTYNVQLSESGMRSVILTNAHVAHTAIQFEAMVNEGKTVMYIIYPGRPYIKYTGDSDRFGSPAAVLLYDQEPLLSWSVDSALMVTTSVAGRSECYAELGNSDKVFEGMAVAAVGNPAGYHKYTTLGHISNTNYNMLQTHAAEYILKHLNGPMMDWIKNSCFWIDTPIGAGGVSGSGVWALDGPEKGKVIALRNMGLGRSCDFKMATKPVPLDDKNIVYGRELKLSEITKDSFQSVFGDYSIQENEYMPYEATGLKPIPQDCGVVMLSGMNGCVPINKVKNFIESRGIDVEKLHFGRAKEAYWTR